MLTVYSQNPFSSLPFAVNWNIDTVEAEDPFALSLAFGRTPSLAVVDWETDDVNIYEPPSAVAYQATLGRYCGSLYHLRSMYPNSELGVYGFPRAWNNQVLTSAAAERMVPLIAASMASGCSCLAMPAFYYDLDWSVPFYASLTAARVASLGVLRSAMTGDASQLRAIPFTGTQSFDDGLPLSTDQIVGQFVRMANLPANETFLWNNSVFAPFQIMNLSGAARTAATSAYMTLYAPMVAGHVAELSALLDVPWSLNNYEEYLQAFAGPQDSWYIAALYGGLASNVF